VPQSPDEFKPTDADEAISAADLAAESLDADLSPPTAENEPSCEQLQEELNEVRDRLLRSQAELENFRRRMQREMQEERRFANQPLLLDLLPVLDNMERAIHAAQKGPEAAGLLEGFKMLHQLLISTLDKYHCRRIEAHGVQFDPLLHEALAQVPSSEHPEGWVTHVNQPGYRLHERVIRPAQVVVSSGPPAVEEPN
jgi:molecular chaperone GrpE